MDEKQKYPAAKPAYDPFEPPDARWRRAEKIAEGSEVADEYTDSDVMAAVSHLKARAVPNTPGFDPCVAAALGIYRDDILLRIEVEARIISGQTDLEIANAVGMPEDVICYYRSTCFDTYGGATDYLAKHVTGLRGIYEFKNHEVREFILFHAIQGGGPFVLEFWLKAMRTAHRAGERPQLSDYLRADRKLPAGLQRLVAMWCSPFNQIWNEWWSQIGIRLNAIKLQTHPAAKAIQSIRLHNDVLRVGRAVLAGATLPPVDTVPPKHRRPKRHSPPHSSPKQTRPQSVHELQTQLQELMRSL